MREVAYFSLINTGSRTQRGTDEGSLSQRGGGRACLRGAVQSWKMGRNMASPRQHLCVGVLFIFVITTDA